MVAAVDAVDAGVETSQELMLDNRDASEVAQRGPRRCLGGRAGRLSAAAVLIAAGAAATSLAARRRAGGSGSVRAEVPEAVGLQAALAGMSVCGAIYCNITGTCCADALCCGEGAECCTGSAGGGTICCSRGSVCCNGMCCASDAVCCKNGIKGRAQGAICGAAGSVCRNGIVLAGPKNTTASTTTGAPESSEKANATTAPP
mmetsp:Transcript_85555/g.242234  ORF Transcript_85555/g.242234 Transcript_85555/m.242234 type:complete len:202 (-) Transcript_85555:146-751(-)